MLSAATHISEALRNGCGEKVTITINNFNMKKIISVLISVFFFVLSNGDIQAQNVELITSVKKKHRTRIDELLAEKPIYINGTSPNLIASRAIRNFSKDFKDATDVRWVLSDGGGYIVKFIYKGVACRADYDYKGYCLTSYKYYNEDKLPREVRQLLKSTYFDFSIYRVAELFISDKTVYLVTLESNESWMKISVIDGEMTIVEKFRKS